MNGTFNEEDDEPILLKDCWAVVVLVFPLDPIFEDYDLIMGYCTTQRLLREEYYYCKSSVV